ncbi:hypothetical protein NIES2101_21565 [Calothrix sp. HK-06]|nr:hypothetical protein NIES2101_21565 [Calothrix sp. HK-06]
MDLLDDNTGTGLSSSTTSNLATCNYNLGGSSSFDLQSESLLGKSSSERNVLIFVADGLRPGSVNPEDAPTLSSIRSEGVDFVNSHSLFPTFTTPNASAIATGHYLGDTGDFSNTIYTRFPTPSANGSPTPFIENDAVLGDLNAQFKGNYDASDPDTFSYYNFLNEETLLQFARNNGYNTAAVGKLGPTLIQDVSQGSRDPSTGTVPPSQTIIIDDSTGKTGGVPLSQDVIGRLVTAGVGATAPDRSNGVPAGTPLNNGFSGNNTTSGTQAANYVQQQYFTDAVTKAILPQFGADYSSSDKPFAMVYWSRDPDGTQHNQGDSLNSLTPGINGATSKAAVKNADNNLAQIIDELKSQKLADGSSLYENTDIFITSDHGFSTISKSPIDTQGNVVKDYASSLTFPGVNPGFLPPGFVAIDIAHDLGLTLYDPDTPVTDSSGKAVAYKPVDPTTGQRPTAGNGLIGGSGQILAQPDAKVVVAANGGSDLIYVPDNDVETVKKVVDFLSKQDYTSGLFVNDDFGAVPGALPLSSINLKGSAQTPTPSIVLNFRTFATDPNNPINSQVEIADSGLQQGQGMHGSFGRGDTYNNMLAIGPDFKRGYTDNAPVSNADVATTLANVLGFNIPSNGDLTGRVLNEALVGGPDSISYTTGILKSDPTDDNVRTYLNYQQVGDTRYFDAAGFADRTVGLTTLPSDVVEAPDRPFPGPQPDGTAITTQGWFLTPAGKQVGLGDRPYGLAQSPDGKTLLVSNNGQSTQSLMVVDRETGNVVQTIPYDAPEALYIGVGFSPDGKHAYASAGGNNKIRVYDVDGQHLTETDPIVLPPQTPDGKPLNLYPAGFSISADGKSMYVADNLGDAMSIIDLPSRTVIDTIQVGHNPYTVALANNGKFAYVSNWGDTTVSAIDIPDREVEYTIEVGTHPNAMALNPHSNELYVANADSDTISVIDTKTKTVTRTIDLAPYPGAKEGSSPNALTVSPDGSTLYVANATNNDVAVIRLATTENPEDKVIGLIPTAWYPTGLVLSPDGKELDVINAKGLGAGSNPDGPNPYRNPSSPPNQYIGSMIQGSLSMIDLSDPSQLAQYTEQVVQNNGFNEGDKIRVAGQPNEDVIPLRAGDPSPIKHVIYVIKENRTYDQVLGSLEKGNGEPNLNLFGEESAPNQRQLARQFVTLDNFYADAEVSADGWNWSTAALANTYVQKNWPANYSSPGRNRPYDFEGGNYATSPGTDPTDAFIWNKLSDAGIDYRNYGFRVFGGQVAANTTTGETTEPRLAANTDLNFPGYDLTISDQTRFNEWLNEFQQYEASGQLPTVEFVRLPNDHTSGTRIGAPTPRAYMADNDLALGKLVDAVSHSPFWKDTAIFVVEDDAQNGPDHVDAHRTVAQVISPYTQTGKVDSTFYDTSAMLRTMEQIVGIGPLSQFDAAATPMLNSFTDTPDFTPYTAITPTQPLDELNPVNAPLAVQAASADFSQEDRVPDELLTAMVWKSVKGADSEVPASQTSFRTQSGNLNGEDDDDINELNTGSLGNTKLAIDDDDD